MFYTEADLEDQQFHYSTESEWHAAWHRENGVPIVEITYITIERDQDHPRRENLWDPKRRCWYTRERADIATTVHHTLRGTHTERWVYADTRGVLELGPPRYRWTSLSGGTPPPDSLIASLNEAIAQSS